MKHYLFVYLLIFFSYYLLLQQNFLCCDDWRYVVSMETGEPIVSLWDAIRSQLFFYMQNTGRFIGHTLMQYLSSKREMGLMCANVVSGILFTGLCYLLFRLLAREVCRKSLLVVIMLFLLLGVPVAGYNFLGNIAFQINYVWTSFAFFCFVYCLSSKFIPKYRINRVLLLLFAMITGSLQESFSIGGVVALICYWLINRRWLMQYHLLMVCSFIIGAAALILAPGNYCKHEELGAVDHQLFYRLVNGFGQIMVYSKLFTLLCIILIIWGIKDRVKTMTFIKENTIFFVTALVNALFAALIILNGPHQLTCVELCSMVLLIKLIYRAWEHYHLGEWLDSVLRWCGVTVMVVLIVPIYYYRAQVKNAFETMADSARQSVDGVMVSTKFDMISFSDRNWFVRNYTTTEFNQGTFLDWLSIWMTDGTDPNRINCRLPLPKAEIIAMCNDSNRIDSCVFRLSGNMGFFHVIRYPLSEEHSQCILFCRKNILSKIRSLITGNYSDVCQVIQDLPITSHFEDVDNSYYVIYSYDVCPVVSVKLL